MKFLQILFLAGMLAIVAGTRLNAQVVEIGTESLTNISIPIEAYYGYTYTQSLYMQSELNLANKRITKIAFHFNGTGAFTDQVAVYMGHSSLTKLTSFVAGTGLTKVFDGGYTVAAVDGWYEMVLTTPFEYNNTDNLIIGIDENSSGYHANANEFFCSATADTMTVNYYSDGTNPDPLNPPAGKGSNMVNKLLARPNIQITFEDLPTGANISIMPSTLDFGIIEENTTKDLSVVIYNTGVSALEVTGVNVNAPFICSISPTLVIQPGQQSSPTTITFAPTADGIFDGTLSFVSNATTGNANVELTGAAYPEGIVFESFEGVFPPLGWDNTGDWTQGSAPVDGLKNAYLGFNKAGVLSTPKLDIVAGDSLTFFAKKSSSSATAKILVKYSPDKTNWVQIDSIPLTGTYAYYMIDLTVAAGTNYIAFDGAGISYLDMVMGPMIHVSATPPDPATNPVPADTTVDVYLATSLSWQGLINADGYKISIGTDNPPTNMINLVDLGNVTSYDLTGLNYGTQYLWMVTPYNQYGSTINPTVWSFTTMNDPLISSFPYTQGFEDHNGLVPPIGWTGESFMRGAEEYTGLYCARVSYAHTGPAFLNMPYMNLPASHRISFWWKDDDISTSKAKYRDLNKIAEHDTTFFEISVDHGTNWTVLAYLAEAAPATVYKQEVIDLSAYAGDSVLLRWRDVTDGASAAYGTGIDEILIEAIPVNPILDLNLTSWNAGSIVLGTSVESGNIFTITNTGAGVLSFSTTTGFVGDFSTDFNPDTTIASNESYSFGFTYTPGEVGTDTMTFAIESNGGNAEITLTGEGINPVSWTFEGFEGETFPPLGWLTVDNDGDTYNWFVLDSVVYAHTGTKCAGSDSWYNQVVLTPDNFLIAPSFTVTQATSMLKWWAAAQDPDYPADHYGVFVSTTGNAVADFTEMVFEETLESSVWEQRQVNLSEYLGQEIFIAFRHYNCTDNYVMKIDDIELAEAVNTAPVFTSAPVTEGEVGQAYYYAISATDADADPLWFESVVLPEWLSLDDLTDGHAALTGTPSAAGDFNVTIFVSDGIDTVQQVFVITVLEANEAPEFTSVPVDTARVGVVYTYNVIATDADADVLSISLTDGPAWMTLTDNGDGTATVSGTPLVQGIVSVTIMVTDGIDEVEQTWNLTVYPGVSVGTVTAARIGVYPNPAVDYVSIKGIENARVEICNIAGETVLTQNNVNRDSKIEVSQLASGSYVVKVSTIQGVSFMKININR